MARLAYSSPALKIPDGTDAGFERIGPANDLLVSQLQGEFYESNRQGNLFYAANQAAVTTTIALATTYTGLCISNPAGNTKDIIVRACSIKYASAPAGISLFYLIGGYSAAGITAHTTPLVYGTSMASLNLGNTQVPTALLDAAATLVNPRVLMPLGAAFTAANLPADTPNYQNLLGAVILQPGGWCALGTLTVSSVFGAFWWSEIPRQT